MTAFASRQLHFTVESSREIDALSFLRSISPSKSRSLVSSSSPSRSRRLSRSARDVGRKATLEPVPKSRLMIGSGRAGCWREEGVLSSGK